MLDKFKILDTGSVVSGISVGLNSGMQRAMAKLTKTSGLKVNTPALNLLDSLPIERVKFVGSLLKN
jgi:hypothetical protein